MGTPLKYFGKRLIFNNIARMCFTRYQLLTICLQHNFETWVNAVSNHHNDINLDLVCPNFHMYLISDQSLSPFAAKYELGSFINEMQHRPFFSNIILCVFGLF